MKQNQINPIALTRMFDQLAEKNWAHSDDLFSKDFCRQLAQECQRLAKEDLMQPASVGGRGPLSTKVTRPEIRGDHTFWLNTDLSSSSSTEAHNLDIQAQFVECLHEILTQLNQSFYLGLKSVEAHFAMYPPGTGYAKHVDNHRGEGTRKVTFILYLNENWQPGHGGELSLFTEHEEPVQITPRLGHFVLFRSEIFPHQVEKSFQPRLSVTGWFRNDAL